MEHFFGEGIFYPPTPPCLASPRIYCCLNPPWTWNSLVCISMDESPWHGQGIHLHWVEYHSPGEKIEQVPGIYRNNWTKKGMPCSDCHHGGHPLRYGHLQLYCITLICGRRMLLRVSSGYPLPHFEDRLYPYQCAGDFGIPPPRQQTLI